MAINYGPYLSVLDPAGPVFIKIQAGVDPVVSANIGLFRANPAPPPPFIAVGPVPVWPQNKTTSNVLPVIQELLTVNPALLHDRRLMVLIGFSVLAPNPSPTYQYKAMVTILQNGQTKGEVPVVLTNADLQKWHQYAIDFKVVAPNA